MAVTTYTDAELLALVRSALGGQLSRGAAEVTINGRRVGSFSLTELIELEKYYTNKVADAAGGRRPAVVTFRPES